MDDELIQVCRELERVRAENVRLSRLLDLRGQDTAPAPEQLAATRPVTMSSPVADKLAMYADLFRARTDVYAVRWENNRTGASGWMPAVAGGWRKGMDRRGATHLRLTSEVVAAHLRGDVFIGLYPLLTTNMCHFLVADFDGPGGDARRSRVRQGSASRWRPRRGGDLAVGGRARVGALRRRGHGHGRRFRRNDAGARGYGAAGIDGPACARTIACSRNRTCHPREASAT